MKKLLTICLSLMTALTITSCLSKEDVTDMFDKRKGDLGYIHNDTEHAVDLYFPWLGEELHYHIEPGKVYELDELDFWHIKQDFTLDTRTMRFCFDDGTSYTHQTIPNDQGKLTFVPEANNIFHADGTFYPNPTWKVTKGNPSKYDYYITK